MSLIKTLYDLSEFYYFKKMKIANVYFNLETWFNSLLEGNSFYLIVQLTSGLGHKYYHTCKYTCTTNWSIIFSALSNFHPLHVHLQVIGGS